MKKLLVVLAAILTLAAANPPKITQSVFPLYQVTEGTDGYNKWRNICSVFSIHEKANLFMTAAHCVLEDDGSASMGIRVDGHPAVLYTMDQENDIAVIQASQPAKQIRLSRKAAEFGDRVTVPNYQLALQMFQLHFGWITNPNGRPVGWDRDYLWHQSDICGGSSGAPILNEKGHLVSIEQIGFRFLEPCGEIAGGATWEQLREFAPFFAKK